MEYKYTGIVLNKRDVGETDRLYAIYTQEMGKVQSVAVGVRKSQSKLAGSLENFNLVDFSVERTRGMGKITGVIVENSFSNLREDLSSLSEIFRNIKILDRLIGLEEKDEEIFNLLLEYLELVNDIDKNEEGKVSIIGHGFMFKVLDHLGYGIEVGECVACGKSIELSDDISFNSKEGGVVCNRCPALNGTVRVSNNLVKILRIFFSNKLSSLEKLKVGKKNLNELDIVLKDFLAWTSF